MGQLLLWGRWWLPSAERAEFKVRPDGVVAGSVTSPTAWCRSVTVGGEVGGRETVQALRRWGRREGVLWDGFGLTAPSEINGGEKVVRDEDDLDRQSACGEFQPHVPVPIGEEAYRGDGWEAAEPTHMGLADGLGEVPQCVCGAPRLRDVP